MKSTLIFWSITGFYSLLMIVLGVFIWLKNKKNKPEDSVIDFWIASRQFPGWRLGVSLTAGWLMLGWLSYGMSMIYQMGLSGVWILPLPWFILCLLILWMVPHVRRLPAYSLPDAIQKRFGSMARTIIALSSVFVFVSWTGAELYMLGTLAAPFLKTPPWVLMVFFAFIIMTYSYLGGFRAVIVTDIVQFVLMALFILFLCIVSFHAASTLTHGSILQTLAKTATPCFGPGTMFNLFACGSIMPLILLVAYLPGWMIEQDLLLRIQAAKSLKEAYKGSIWGFVLLSIFVIGLPTLIAFCAIVLFPPSSEISRNLLGADATGMISALIQNYFPVWGQACMLIGLIAAQMSTVDTFANVVALPLMHDLIQPAFFADKSKEQITQWSRIIFVFSIVLGLIYALNANSLMVIYTLSSGVLTAAIAIPVFAIYFKKANHFGIILSSLFGCLGTIIFYYIEFSVVKHSYAPRWLSETQLGYIIVGIFCSIIGLILGIIFGKESSMKHVSVISQKPLEGIAIFKSS